MIKEYIKVFYNLFNEYEGYGFYGNKRVMRYKLQLKMNRHIPEKYIDLSLKIFKEAGLINRNTTQTGKSDPIIIGDLVFGGSKFIWTKIELDENVVNEKLEALEHMFENFENDTTPVVEENELENYKNIFREKYSIFKKIIQDQKVDYEKRHFDFDLFKVEGLKRYDIDRNYFLKDLKRIKSYDENYFLIKKQHLEREIAQINNEKSNEDAAWEYINKLYNQATTFILEICQDIINKEGQILVTLGNNRHSAYFGDMIVNEVILQDNTLTLKNSNCGIRISDCSIGINETEILFYNSAGCEEVSIEVCDTSKQKLMCLSLLLEKANHEIFMIRNPGMMY